MKSRLSLATIVGAVASLLVACAGDNLAQDKKAPDKHDAAALYNALRDVINVGAKLFNEQGDHAGCYRLYQGSLLSVRPFLPADQQKNIDDAFVMAEKLPNYGDRAFELRKVLDDIRAKAKPAGVVEGKGPAVKDDKSTVNGKITYQGKPVSGGYFVTLVGAEGKKFSSAIQKDGTFQFKTPITPGEYRVLVEPIPGEGKGMVPTRYASETTSGLAINIQAGKQQVDFDLVN